MPIITGPITRAGPLIDVRISVPDSIPRPPKPNASKHVFARVLIDTGSDVTGFAPHVFEQIGSRSVGAIEIYTPSTPITTPHTVPEHLIFLAVVANGAVHPIGITRAIEAAGCHPDEGVDGLIGRDFLSYCQFEYDGLRRQFELRF